MKKFLTTAPVFAAIWFTVTAGIMIEFNRFFPDLLFHPPVKRGFHCDQGPQWGPFFVPDNRELRQAHQLFQLLEGHLQLAVFHHSIKF